MYDAIRLSNGAKISYSTIIQLEPSFDSIKIESGATVQISHCESNKDFNVASASPYTNSIPVPNNVIWTETGEIFKSPDGSKWRLTIDNSGIVTTQLV